MIVTIAKALIVIGIACFLAGATGMYIASVAMEMPLSWDDDSASYVPCFNCQDGESLYSSCKDCPFYKGA